MRHAARTLVVLAALSWTAAVPGAAHAGEEPPPPPPSESCPIWVPDGGNSIC
ncbi:hypothetical protein [Nocardioides speluncae]|uniref:hypothetical protein n=1 Tax=Nocardioides speluncae TaxID=2670337 RepID=UPI0012B182B4|nr:hypothetical protein [Nocardioides speluncae]